VRDGSGGSVRRLPYLSLSLLIVALDQATKFAVDRFLSLHESRSLVPGVLSFTYVRNRGAAFGILSEAALPHQTLFFSLVSFLALAGIVAYALWLPAHERLSQVALGLVMGGAVGNLLDRARHGYVVDFVDVFWGTHHWPAFNVADSAITTGVALVVLDMLVSQPGEQSVTVRTPSRRTD
jgi:signal peptidase II